MTDMYSNRSIRPQPKGLLIYGPPTSGKSEAAKLQEMSTARDTDALLPPEHGAGKQLPPDVVKMVRTSVLNTPGIWFTNMPIIVQDVARNTDWPILYYSIASASDLQSRFIARDGVELARDLPLMEWAEEAKASGRALGRTLPSSRFAHVELAEGKHISDTLLDDMEKIGYSAPRSVVSQSRLSKSELPSSVDDDEEAGDLE